MASCTQCGQFTKFEGGLCYSCYAEKKNGEEPEPETMEIRALNSGGLTEKERAYRYGMIKGRIAETLVQELFLSLGYNVFRYGMENTIPGIMELLKGVRSEVAQEIRRMPDFVDLPKNYPFENAFFIVVSKKHIKCISFQELKEGKSISPESRNYLGSRKEFDLDKDVIIEFCEFAVKFFSQV
jgi:hypothetical protein